MFDLAQKLLSLSQQMLSCTENKEWKKLSDIQAERAELVRQLDVIDMSALDYQKSTEMGALLLQIRNLEKQCIQLVETQRRSLTAEHTKVSKGKAMQKAYGAYSNRR